MTSRNCRLFFHLYHTRHTVFSTTYCWRHKSSVIMAHSHTRSLIDRPDSSTPLRFSPCIRMLSVWASTLNMDIMKSFNIRSLRIPQSNLDLTFLISIFVEISSSFQIAASTERPSFTQDWVWWALNFIHDIFRNKPSGTLLSCTPWFLGLCVLLFVLLQIVLIHRSKQEQRWKEGSLLPSWSQLC